MLHTTDLERTLRFAKLIALALAPRQPPYVALGRIMPDNELISIGGWTGKPPTQRSNAPFIAHAKMAEVYHLGADKGLSLTPTPNFVFGMKYMGGARKDNYAVGVSKWSEEHDKLLALILLYSMTHELRLHHVGIPYETEEAMWVASSEIDLPQVTRPEQDHLRVYHRVHTNLSDNNCFYREVQHFPDGPYEPHTHLDFATNNPEHFLVWLASAFGEEPTLWQRAPHSPVGVFGVQDPERSTLKVMARPQWTDVEVWPTITNATW